jgi:hypothetical protein
VRPILLGLLLLSACDDGSSYLVVTVESGAPLSVTQLAVTALNAGQSATVNIPGAWSLPPAQSFALHFPAGRSGDVTVEVVASGAAGELARATGTTALVVGGTATLTLQLTPGSFDLGGDRGDAGAARDLSGADLAGVDLSTADLSTADLAVQDLAVPPGDLAGADLATPVDLRPPPDLAGADLLVKPRVLIVGSDTPSNLGNFQTQEQNTGAFSVVDTFDARSATPTVAQLQSYDAVLVFLNVGFADYVALGDNLATYYDGGGRVVLCSFIWVGGFTQGRFFVVGNGYMLLDYATAGYVNESIGTVVEPTSPLMAGVQTLTWAGSSEATTLVNGGVAVAKWKVSGNPLVVRGVVKGRNRADLNFFLPGTPGDGALLIRNALLYQ